MTPEQKAKQERDKMIADKIKALNEGKIIKK
jgi:hypothetical protein